MAPLPAPPLMIVNHHRNNQMKRLALALVCLAPFSACRTQNAGSDSALDDISTEKLWAGKVTANLDRETSDACRDGLGDNLVNGEVSYGSWARQRAAHTNICFEVWMPGVTDQENPDFWRLIDVKVHYRYENEATFRTEAVASLDRRGNNRRYAWNLRQHDPFRDVTAPAAVPYRVLSRRTGTDGRVWGSAESVMEVYFTVNDQRLAKQDGSSISVKYGDVSIVLTE